MKKYPNITILCWIFPQDVIYKIFFDKIISKLHMNQIEFLSQFDNFSVSASSNIFQLNPI